MKEPPFVHGVRQIQSFDVISGGNLVGEGGYSREKALRASLVKIPAAELIHVTSAFEFADLLAIADAEVHTRIRSTPVEARVGAGLRMQEHAVLHLAPFGIHLDVRHGHFVERIWVGTGLVHVPSLKNKTLRALRELRHVIVVLGDRRTVRDKRDVVRIQQRTRVVAQFTIIAIHVYTVKEENVILFRNVVKFCDLRVEMSFIGCAVMFITFKCRRFLIRCYTTGPRINGIKRMIVIVMLIRIGKIDDVIPVRLTSVSISGHEEIARTVVKPAQNILIENAHITFYGIAAIIVSCSRCARYKHLAGVH